VGEEVFLEESPVDSGRKAGAERTNYKRDGTPNQTIDAPEQHPVYTILSPNLCT
jgi:hypothetical protein